MNKTSNTILFRSLTSRMQLHVRIIASPSVTSSRYHRFSLHTLVCNPSGSRIPGIGPQQPNPKPRLPVLHASTIHFRFGNTSANPPRGTLTMGSVGACTADGQRAFATLPKIKVDKPIVDLDGDEMTRCDSSQRLSLPSAEYRLRDTQSRTG